MWPATQDKQESPTVELGLPPHTTSLPPDRRETGGRALLASGRSGMEQASEEGRGNNSTDERWSSYP